MSNCLNELRAQTATWDGAEGRIRAGITAIEQDLALDELRRSQHLSQTDVAERMGVTQRRVSAIENSGDLHVATLRRYVESLGGALELAVVKDGERIRLSR